jgi:hypothetical protein
MSSMGPRAFVLVVVVAAIGVCAPPAWGAFRGRDGDLVVATGSGLELVAPGTGAARSICTDVVLCGQPAQPSVSPSGRAIAFVDTVSRRPVVIAADGSCLWCLMGAPLTTLTGSEPAFTPGGHGVTVARNGLWSVSLTGGGARRVLGGRVEGAVWSSRGVVAVVRGGWIWVGRPGHGKLRRLARGHSPSFSPDGARLASAYHGYVWIVRVADGSERRLVRGGAPAWSPDGLQIAWIAPGGAVEIVAVQGGRSRRVGSVSGTALDWQPLPSSRRHMCKRPARATVLASNGEAVLFSQDGERFYGCLKALGVTRLLLDTNTQSAFGGTPTGVRLAGRFAALQLDYSNQYSDYWETATLYDLSRGKATPLAEVTLHAPGAPSVDSLDFLALDGSGFAAWGETMRPVPQPIAAISCPSASLCVAGDQTGILSSTNPMGGASAWNSAAVASISGVSCPSVSLCVAVDGNYVLTATDPSGGASAWTKITIDKGGFGLNAVSCPSVSLCVAVDNSGNALTATDPTGGASAWTKTNIDTGTGNFLNAVSCPSVSLCVAVDDSGNALASTDPTAGASAWTKTTIHKGGLGPNVLDAVSCPSVSICVAGDLNGNILTSTDPTGGASAWTKTNIDTGTGNFLNAVSCPSVSLCVAVDDSGNALTSTDPTGGASTWTRTPVDGGAYLTAVSCASVSLCVAGDRNGNILTSTDPTGGANTWTRAAVYPPGCTPQSTPCISEQLYAHDDQSTRVVDTAPPGQGNSIGNVALNSLALTWTHDGAQRQLQLR